MNLLGSEEQHLHQVFTDTITVWCRHMIQYCAKLTIDGLLAVTLDDTNQTFIPIKATFDQTNLTTLGTREERLRQGLTDTINLLCRQILNYTKHAKLDINGLIGVTRDTKRLCIPIKTTVPTPRWVAKSELDPAVIKIDCDSSDSEQEMAMEMPPTASRVVENPRASNQEPERQRPTKQQLEAALWNVPGLRNPRTDIPAHRLTARQQIPYRRYPSRVVNGSQQLPYLPTLHPMPLPYQQHGCGQPKVITATATATLSEQSATSPRIAPSTHCDFNVESDMNSSAIPELAFSNLDDNIFSRFQDMINQNLPGVRNLNQLQMPSLSQQSVEDPAGSYRPQATSISKAAFDADQHAVANTSTVPQLHTSTDNQQTDQNPIRCYPDRKRKMPTLQHENSIAEDLSVFNYASDSDKSLEWSNNEHDQAKRMKRKTLDTSENSADSVSNTKSLFVELNRNGSSDEAKKSLVASSNPPENCTKDVSSTMSKSPELQMPNASLQNVDDSADSTQPEASCISMFKDKDTSDAGQMTAVDHISTVPQVRTSMDIQQTNQSSEDRPDEQRDRFEAQLSKYLDDRGTPLIQIAGQDLDLIKLYHLVWDLGGYNKVTKQMKWVVVCAKMGLPPETSATEQIQMVHKKHLHPFVAFYRMLGCTMGTITKTRSRRSSGSRLTFPERDSDSRTKSVHSQKKRKEDGDNGCKLKDEKRSKRGLEDNAASEVSEEKSAFSKDKDDDREKALVQYPPGTKLKIRYGQGKNLKMYEAKVIEVKVDEGNVLYKVHFAGFNSRHDEWLSKSRIVGTVEAPNIKLSETNTPSVKPSKGSAQISQKGSAKLQSSSVISTPGGSDSTTAESVDHDAASKNSSSVLNTPGASKQSKTSTVLKTPSSTEQSKSSSVLKTPGSSKQTKTSSVLNTPPSTEQSKSSSVLMTPGASKQSKTSSVLKTPGSSKQSKSSTVLKTPSSTEQSKSSPVLKTPGASKQSKTSSVLKTPPSTEQSKSSPVLMTPASNSSTASTAVPTTISKTFTASTTKNASADTAKAAMVSPLAKSSTDENGPATSVCSTMIPTTVNCRTTPQAPSSKPDAAENTPPARSSRAFARGLLINSAERIQQGDPKQPSVLNRTTQRHGSQQPKVITATATTTTPQSEHDTLAATSGTITPLKTVGMDKDRNPETNMNISEDSDLEKTTKDRDLNIFSKGHLDLFNPDLTEAQNQNEVQNSATADSQMPTSSRHSGDDSADNGQPATGISNVLPASNCSKDASPHPVDNVAQDSQTDQVTYM